MAQASEIEGPRSPWIEEIGAEMEEMRQGYVRMGLRVEKQHTNPNGVMHGGVATSVMDEATGAVIASVRGMDAMAAAPHATVEMSVSFLAGVWPGDDLVVEARAVRVGQTVAFAEADVRRRNEEKLLARGKFTYVVAPTRQSAPAGSGK